MSYEDKIKASLASYLDDPSMAAAALKEISLIIEQEILEEKQIAFDAGYGEGIDVGYAQAADDYY